MELDERQTRHLERLQCPLAYEHGFLRRRKQPHLLRTREREED
jgi:hypothetical protein